MSLSFMPFNEFKSVLTRVVDLAKVGASLTPNETDDKVVEIVEKVVNGDVFASLYHLVFPEATAE